MNSETKHPYIDHLSDREKYAPPAHNGTVNVRLTDKTFCENFELVLGRVDVGGLAERHHHEVEYQAIYVLSGMARITLGDDEPIDCGPGSIVRLPPKLDHQVVAIGDTQLEVVMVYSPPLPKRGDVPVS